MYLLLSLKFHPQMVIGIQHLQTSISSPMDQKCISKRPKTIQSTIKSACAETTQGACVDAPFKNAGKRTHAHDARPWMQKTLHPSKRHIYDIGWPPTHFYLSIQVDLASKSQLNLAGWLVKDLRVP